MKREQIEYIVLISFGSIILLYVCFVYLLKPQWGKLDKNQKQEIAKEITDVMQRVANKPASYTYIVFEEVESEDWAIGGNLLG